MYFVKRVTKEKGLEGFVDRLMGEYIGEDFKRYGPEVEEYDYCLLTYNAGTREAIFHFLKSFSCLGSICCVYYADKEFWSNKDYMETFEAFDEHWSSTAKKVQNVENPIASNGGSIASNDEFDFDPALIEWLKSESKSFVHPSRYTDWCDFIDKNALPEKSYYRKRDFIYVIKYMQRLCSEESIFDIALDFRRDSNEGVFAAWLVRPVLFSYSYRGPELSYLTYKEKLTLKALGTILLKIIENKKMYSNSNSRSYSGK